MHWPQRSSLAPTTTDATTTSATAAAMEIMAENHVHGGGVEEERERGADETMTPPKILPTLSMTAAATTVAVERWLVAV